MTSIKDFKRLRQEIINETIEERNNFYNFNRYLAKLIRKKQGVILHPLKIA